MVKNKKTILTYILCGAVLLAVLGAFCMFFAIVSDFSPELGYFEKGSVKAGILYAVLGAGIGLAAITWLLFKKSVPDKTDIPTPIYTKIVSGILILTLLWHTGTDLSRISQITLANSSTLLPHWGLYLLSDLLALLFIVYLIFDIAPEKLRKNPLAICSSFFPPFYAAIQLFIIYLNLSTATNSPIKIINQLMYISFMLFLTGIAGLSLERKSVFPQYLFSMVCTVIIGGTVSISAVLELITGASGYTMEYSQIAFSFAMTIYALCRLLTLALSDSVVLKPAAEEVDKTI